jgi:hypothetical protein
MKFHFVDTLPSNYSPTISPIELDLKEVLQSQPMSIEQFLNE